MANGHQRQNFCYVYTKLKDKILKISPSIVVLYKH